MSKLIEDFYLQEGLQEEFTLEQIREICKSPFLFAKDAMSSGELKDIRYQYLAVFTVSPSAVKWSRKKLEEKYQQGLMSQKKYDIRNKTLSNYEKRQED